MTQMETTPKIFFIKNELCRRAGLAASWLPVNKIGIFPHLPLKAHSPDKPSSYGPADASIFHVRQEVILFEPVLRKLVNEANGIFVNVQNLEFKSDLLNFSHQYRSIIRACLENLQDDLMQSKSKEKETLQNYITIFYSVELIWHLCEILFIQNIPGDIVVPYLLEWIRFHFPKHERKAAILLSGDTIGIESQPEYWDTVLGCLMQGRIEVVRALLHVHSSSDSDHFRLADQILKSMPIYNYYKFYSAEFEMCWKRWLMDVQSKIDAKLFIREKNLHLIMRLIVGEEAAWNEIQNRFEAWYEFLAAWLFFTEPIVKTYELVEYAQQCISRMDYSDRLKHLDHVLIAAMDVDVLQVVKEIQRMNENGWFVSHLTDLFYHSGRLEVFIKTDISQDSLSIKLRESFLIDYGTLLMGHNSLWQVGLSYLDHCPAAGNETIEFLLLRLPLRTEAKSLKIIREAQKRQMHHVAQSVCKLQGLNSLRKGRLGNALMWSLKSQDGLFVSHIADKFLKSFTDTGVMQNVDLLDNLGSAMLACDRLIFLGKYREFQKCFEDKQYKDAASILISLISSKIIPKYFWATLLVDAIPLLENEKLILSSNDTYTLLHCLEEKSSSVEIKDKLEQIRLAIASNLGRALIFEAQRP